jgi:hypothetical protein
MPFMQVFVRAVCTATTVPAREFQAFIEVAKRARRIRENERNDQLARQLAAEVKTSGGNEAHYDS